MSESTLSIAYADLRSEIGDYLGIGRDPTLWSTNDVSRVAGILSSGLKQFYFPASGHRWSFLSPAATLAVGPTTGTVSGVPVYDGSTYSTITTTGSVFKSRMASFETTITFDTSSVEYTISSYTSATVVKVLGDASGELTGDTIAISSQEDYDLPDDYGSIVGSMCFDSSSSGMYPPVRLTSEYNIRSLRQDSSSSSAPQYVAIRPIANSGVTGQRFEAMFYPTPSSNWTLQYKYSVLPNTISDSATYPLGGASHSETVLASCLAIAEERYNDTLAEKRQSYNERLQASMALDSRQYPDFYGYNGDNSRGVYGSGIGQRHGDVLSVTYINS